jgi:hypothetical protein
MFDSDNPEWQKMIDEILSGLKEWRAAASESDLLGHRTGNHAPNGRFASPADE